MANLVASETEPFNRLTHEQANFLSDGEALMDKVSHVQHVARAMLQMVCFFMRQLPQHYLARVNKDVFLSSFSYVENGVRVGVGSWDEGPGWQGEDVKIGKQYPEDVDLATLSGDELTMLYNSDSYSSAPYGNREAVDKAKAFKEHCLRWSHTIPLCVASDLSKVELDSEPNPNIRRGRSVRVCIRPHVDICGDL